MNIFIFASATNNRIREELDELEPGEDNIYLLISKSRAEYFYDNYKSIHIIEFDKKYISYKFIKSAGIISDMPWDIIIVPSSLPNNIYSFGEVYALMTEMKYKRMIWKGSDGTIYEKNNNIVNRIKDGMYSLAAFSVYRIIVLFEHFNSFIHGYKW